MAGPKTLVFAGPTLRSDQVPDTDLEWRPPVGLGDVQRAAEDGFERILIIDGVFDFQPAVGHKEILFALSRGITVAGAASMGALRAAELDSMGMQGVGWVYEQFASGRFEDDDEVAVIHGRAEDGYRLLSEPMVDIRWNLEAAVVDDELSSDTAGRLIEEAKKLHYSERSIAAAFAAAGRPAEELTRLRRWLSKKGRSRKTLDALDLIEHHQQGRLSSRVAVDPPPPPPNTIYWENFLRWVETHENAAEDVLEELALLGPESYQQIFDQARTRYLALSRGRARGVAPGDVRDQVKAAVYRAHRLESRDDLEAWLRRNALSETELDDLIDDESIVRLVLANIEHPSAAQVLPRLRLGGLFARLRHRAREKKHLLALLPADSIPDAETAIDGYFEKIARPRPADLEGWATACGFGNAHAFIEAARLEFAFRKAKGEG